MESIRQNVKIKPFAWANITLIVQFEYCPKCKYFSDCYDLRTLACEYDGYPITIKGQSNYITQNCFEEREDEND